MNNLNLINTYRYYNNCWDNRFENGHNKKSSACHYGYTDVSKFYKDDKEYDTEKNNTNSELIKCINRNKDDKLNILDAGCGYGGSMIYLCRHFVNSLIYGITLTETQIEMTSNNIKNNKLKNGHVIKGNFDKLNYDMNLEIKYDIIYFIESICHSSCKKSTIEYGLSMLKDDGIIIIFDYFENINKKDEGREKKEIIKNGMALPSFINISMIEDIGNIITIKDVTENVLPSMKYSMEKAKILIQNEENIDKKNHLISCIYMYDLHNKGILNYNILIIGKNKLPSMV